MTSTAKGEDREPGGLVEFSTSCSTSVNPPSLLTWNDRNESVPAPPPCALKRTPYSKVPNPSIPMADLTPPLTSEYAAGTLAVIFGSSAPAWLKATLASKPVL